MTVLSCHTVQYCFNDLCLNTKVTELVLRTNTTSLGTFFCIIQNKLKIDYVIAHSGCKRDSNLGQNLASFSNDKFT